ncbi:hypothetical protein GYMLUDRAFT_146728, partial [Collybiopsis luxurians FD-317 M1]
VGAFTEDLDHLDFLFYAGIPVWFLCMMSAMPYVRIDSVVPLIREDHSQQLHRPGGFVLNCTDASPPHRIVYNGAPNQPGRYCSMASYLDSLVN